MLRFFAGIDRPRCEVRRYPEYRRRSHRSHCRQSLLPPSANSFAPDRYSQLCLPGFRRNRSLKPASLRLQNCPCRRRHPKPAAEDFRACRLHCVSEKGAHTAFPGHRCCRQNYLLPQRWPQSRRQPFSARHLQQGCHRRRRSQQRRLRCLLRQDWPWSYYPT